MKKLLLCFALLGSLLSNGQDIHISQFYNTPLLVNPSHTGFFDGTYRLGLNYRNQWSSVTVPFKTFSGFADLGILKNKLFASDWIGLGGAVATDKAGDGDLATVKAFGSLAYHKTITRNFYLSLGGSVSYVSKNVDYNKLYFGSQWDGATFDTGLPNMEDNSADAFNYLDFQAGVNVAFLNEKMLIYLGASMAHISTPDETFYDFGDNQIGRRLFVHFGGKIPMGQSLDLEPGILFTNQKKASDIVAGTNVAFTFTPESPVGTKLIFGGWYRYKDAFIGSVGFEIRRTRMMMSYDINTSSLSTGSHSRGGFELSIIYIGLIEHRPKNLDCPDRF
jgi:type IX secretion system PorP/SprF family membrane protein